MFSVDRKTSAVMVAAGTAGLAATVATIRWGFAAKHPVLGVLGALFLTGPAAGAIAGNAVRMILGPSEALPRIAGEAPGVSRGTPQVIMDAMRATGAGRAAAN